MFFAFAGEPSTIEQDTEQDAEWHFGSRRHHQAGKAGFQEAEILLGVVLYELLLLRTVENEYGKGQSYSNTVKTCLSMPKIRVGVS